MRSTLADEGFAVDIDSLKKKWRSLRDRYKKLKKAGPSGSSAEVREEQQSWPYYEALRFTDAYDEDRESISCAVPSSLSAVSLSESEDDLFSSSPAPKRTKRSRKAEEDVNQLLQKANSCLEQVLAPATDDCELFGQTVAATLRRFPLQAREYAKVEVQRLLYNLEFPSQRPAEMNIRKKRIAAALVVQQALLVLKKSQIKKRRFGVHEICRDRSTLGEFFHLLPQLKKDDAKFFEYLRMKRSTFEKLLGLVEPDLKPKMQKKMSILPEQMLVITLRFLATGMSFRSLHFAFRLGRSTIANTVRETCRVLLNSLKSYVTFPSSPSQWKAISAEFQRRWDFPHVLGCIDGKHIHVNKPMKSGSLYFNFKGGFSTVLLAVCDARYRFLYYDVGCYGHQHDSHVFARSSLGKGIEDNSIAFPEDEPFRSDGQNIPYFFLGDGGFPLSSRLMKPFSGNTKPEEATFNFRLSHARNVIENAFGILSARWRILLKDIETSVDLSDLIVASCIHLHNFIMEEESPGAPRNEEASENLRLQSAPVQPLRSSSATVIARNVRNYLMDFFENEGAVPYQHSRVIFF
ncbi:hypothetical protein QR680_017419 [Steinernema hermaphroditum]|uniref:DDE Tnp4 domain-containing protein n=1 Tax=Steinernema hermaphroditum TaxID=289476 RepID=A0AA39LP37_9BILA|nr:hypothetical protein QR680_017419 [Steinernema hermaphroditum]